MVPQNLHTTSVLPSVLPFRTGLGLCPASMIMYALSAVYITQQNVITFGDLVGIHIKAMQTRALDIPDRVAAKI